MEGFDDVVAGFVVHEDGEGEGAELADAGWEGGGGGLVWRMGRGKGAGEDREGDMGG